MDIIKNFHLLNNYQIKAIKIIKGPVMVIAGAGSGKTRVLTYKIAYLINKGFNPENILALTFTNKSAFEMEERLLKLIGKDKINKISIGTFHSIFSKILRVESKIMGYKSNYTIYNKNETQILIKKIIKEMNLDKDIYKYKNIINYISFYKNNLMGLLKYYDPIILTEAKEYVKDMPRINEIYNIYIYRCYKLNIMDLDDLIFKTSELFVKYSDIKIKYQKKYKYILVDEYQDINYAQYFLIKTLSYFHQNICVVGDDAQSIYAFRGANINNILNFKKDYVNSNIIKLEESYRSTYHIVEAANNIISHNRKQIKKNIWTKNNIGEKITVFKAHSDIEEAIFVVDEILKKKKKYLKNNKDFTILYRNNIQSKYIENELFKRGIPYCIYGNISFYNIYIIRIIISYLKFIFNENDEESLLKIINYPKRGIGNNTIKKLIHLSFLYKISLYEILKNINFYKNELSINRLTLYNIDQFIINIKYIKQKILLDNVYTVTKNIIKLFNLEDNEKNSLVDFIKSIKVYVNDYYKINNKNLTLSNFIEKVSFSNNLEEKNNIKDQILLMTIHASKGLEFPIIFIVGLEENILPSILSKNTLDKIEEERRLFYVALTRAREKVYLSYVTKRNINKSFINIKPSRFINEINSNHIINYNKYLLTNNIKSNSYNNRNLIPKTRIFLKNKTYNDVKNMILLLKKGSNILHEKFGKGEVLFIEGHGNDKIALIKFNKYIGNKKIFLKFSKFKIL